MIGEHVEPILALKNINGIGDKRIINYIKEKKGKVNSSYENIIQTKVSSKISEMSKSEWAFYLEQAREEIEKANNLGINIISYLDAGYPQNLRMLAKAPVILYVKGNYKLLNADKSVAIIGTREPTEYGKKIDFLFSKTLSLDGFVVVSGLAIGCDTYAHMGTLAGSGKTIAILAHGLDQPVYPKQNRQLAETILDNDGALMSTYPIGTKLRPQYLAARDEWQSGMSDGVLVIETGIKGGTRIAMRHSVEQKRVLAVIDYRQRGNLGDKAKQISKFQGNMDGILHEEALPIFTRDELNDFEDRMIKNHEYLLKQLTCPSFNQLNLFS